MRAHQRIESLIAGDGDTADQNNMLSTHPRTADRIAQAIDLADNNGAASDSGNTRRGVGRYLKQIDGMVFGDGVEQGLVRGTRFIHPDMRFEFEVPEGFTIHNKPDMVLAVDDKNNSIKFAEAAAKDVRAAGGMEKFLTRKWSDDATLKNVEWVDINGLKAVTGAASVWTGKRKVDVRRIIIEQDRKHYWRFQFVTDKKDTARLNEAFRRTTYSFHILSRSQAMAVQPWRVRVVTVGQGVTFDDLVGSMAVPEYQKEWFEALNGIGPDDPLIPGSRVKVIK
ncbi:MAG: hypothetical protein JKY27_02575 [Magnetovibrio sp.]|nr:hypothetical protein [Magnetovibrio sp.]